MKTEPTPSLGSDAGTHAVECDQAPNGTPCGEPGAGTHCIFDACLPNACGDGVAADGEECDDGDELDGDGCDARCRLDIPGCGNGVVDPTEECDDGNRNDSDRCTNRCTSARCGDGSKGPGEECDDGNSLDTDSCSTACRVPLDAGTGAGTDAGSDAAVDASSGAGPDAGRDAAVDAATDAGADASRDAAADAASDAAADASRDAAADAATDAAADAATDAAADAATDAAADGGSTADAGPSCEECRATHCTSFEGIDLVAGCFTTINAEWSDPSDPLFLQQCTDIVSCARANGCAHGAIGPIGCYCGAATLDECNQSGPVNPPCRPQWEAGARSSAVADVLQNITNLVYPATWAFYLLDCDRNNCPRCRTN